MKQLLLKAKGHLFEKVIALEHKNEDSQGAPSGPGARGFAHPEPIGVTPLVHRLLSLEQ